MFIMESLRSRSTRPNIQYGNKLDIGTAFIRIIFTRNCEISRDIFVVRSVADNPNVALIHLRTR